MCVHAAQAPSSQHILTHICKHMCEFTEARHRLLSSFLPVARLYKSAEVKGSAREPVSPPPPPSAGLQVCVFPPRRSD